MSAEKESSKRRIVMEGIKRKRVVVKLGSSTLTHKTGRLNIRRVEKLVKILADILNAGCDIVIVSSGAIALGMAKLGLPSARRTRPQSRRARR